jgi:5'-nucleotidase
MNILISNDDGWDAPGITALKEVAGSFGTCVVVAPRTEQSGISHQLTLFRPLRLTEEAKDVWSMDGTPADCVRVALTQMDTPFDLVLSGINNGGNLGADVYVSGTVAAAREAALFGLPSIAMSQHRLRFGEAFNWNRAKPVASKILGYCIEKGLKNRELININFPDFSDLPQETPIPDFEIVDPCPLDPAPRLAVFESKVVEGGTSYQSIGKYNQRPRSPGHDVASCFSGQVPVTRLTF